MADNPNTKNPVDQLLERARDIQGAVQGVDFHASYKVVQDGIRNLMVGDYFHRAEDPLAPIHLPDGGRISSNFFRRGAKAAALVMGAQLGMGLFNGVVNSLGDDSILKQRLDTDGERTKFAMGAASVGAGIFAAAGMYGGRYWAKRFTGHPEKYRKAIATAYGSLREFGIREKFKDLQGRVAAHNAQIDAQFAAETPVIPWLQGKGPRIVDRYKETVPGTVPEGYTLVPGYENRSNYSTRMAGDKEYLDRWHDVMGRRRAQLEHRRQRTQSRRQKLELNRKLERHRLGGYDLVLDAEELEQLRPFWERYESRKQDVMERWRASRGRYSHSAGSQPRTLSVLGIGEVPIPQTTRTGRRPRRFWDELSLEGKLIYDSDYTLSEKQASRGSANPQPRPPKGTSKQVHPEIVNHTRTTRTIKPLLQIRGVDEIRQEAVDNPLIEDLGILDREAMGLNSPISVTDDLTSRVDRSTGKIVRTSTGGKKLFRDQLTNLEREYSNTKTSVAYLMRNAIVPETYGANFAIGSALGIGAFAAGMAKGAFDMALTTVGTVAGLGLVAGQALQKGLFHGQIPGEDHARALTFSEAMQHPQAWSNRAKVFAAGTAVIGAIRHAYNVSGSNKKIRDSVRGISFREARTPGDLGATGNIALNAYYNQKSVWS